MGFLADSLLEIKEYGEILEAINNRKTAVNIIGPSESQKAHFCYAVLTHLGQKGIFITFNEMQARRMHEDFTFFFGDDALYFPSKEIIFHDVDAQNYDSIFQRIKVLDKITEGKYKLVVASAEAAAQMLLPVELFKRCVVTLSPGMRICLDDLAGKLAGMGFERVETVEGRGQFAVRGGIVDIYSANNDYAVRIELFGDEIDSIRRFDTMSQRSVDMLGNVRIVPAREIFCLPGDKRRVIESVEACMEEYVKKIRGKSDPGFPDRLREKIKSDMERIESEGCFPGIDRYIPFIIPNPSDITDYAGNNALVVADEMARLEQRLDNMELERGEMIKNLIEKGKVLPESGKAFFSFSDLALRLGKKTPVLISAMDSGTERIKNARSFSIPCRSIGSYQGHIDLLCREIHDWKNKNSRIVLMAGAAGRGQRLLEELRERGVEAVCRENPEQAVRQGEVAITCGSLNKGFEYPSIGLVVISYAEALGRKRKKKPVSGGKGVKINLFTDLDAGDFVVHQAHGIGQYIGIQTLTVEGAIRDYLKIRYLDGDYLYIPTTQLDLIQKYIGSEGKTPKLNKLGGGEWTRTKNRVKESLKELAGELVKLYARRQSLKGCAFSPDTVWQRQFEELFPYEETEDQLKCVDEIKKDMESDRPMDRLLCGDVGYGKTEVAIRAVFKAVMDGKQVAYLVPTTILAQQHYITFRDRMKDFPVAVEVISRFRTKAEQKKILMDLRAGNIDVLIGTHRLLQKDIQFKNLGLLVVDEEQRFGVRHKEKLKNLRPDIDVLTLTATPIPRTLHMSLIGVRDISVIEDPPEERYPVQTYVMEYDREIVKEAIIRELGRKGQVFYLCNRVRAIETKAAEIRAMVPEARIAAAHGQMEERRLEDIMLAFINGDYDILVCTTIIESGLDMPNVNTIIVEDADRMGLSQLYQLRGRVGRSNRLAYAYVTYKKDKAIPEIAEKRLRAISEFTELGAGFKIAMRDLEIRGAGNLLGPEQHGHMEAVGYDMYCRLLEQAVKELRGQSPEDGADVEVLIDLKINAYIDSDYIGVENQRIEMYKRIASIRDEQDAEDIAGELADRFGELPAAVRNLISIAHIKALAKNAGISSITEKDGCIVFRLAAGKRMSSRTLGKLAERHRRQIMFNSGVNPSLTYRPQDKNKEKMLDYIKIVLHDIKSFEV